MEHVTALVLRWWAGGREIVSFEEWLAAAPPSWETEFAGHQFRLAVNAALDAGWPLESLVADTAAALKRGAGAGLVLTRMRNLAGSRPVARPRGTPGALPECSVCAQPYQRALAASVGPASRCVACGEPLLLREERLAAKAAEPERQTCPACGRSVPVGRFRYCVCGAAAPKPGGNPRHLVLVPGVAEAVETVSGRLGAHLLTEED